MCILEDDSECQLDNLRGNLEPYVHSRELLEQICCVYTLKTHIQNHH